MTRLDLPEPRLNHLCRAVLAQIFINAHGRLMPYGSMPGGYDNCFFGVEEGYAMAALAMFGFARDAQAYLDATYLTRDFLKKVDIYKEYPDRHQQYRNGLEPLYAVEVFRLGRDREWIAKHVPLLVECAEWTLANRRRTMRLEGGAKPLHWGLLEKWSFGGDIASELCYPLYPNFCCWRGLVETAWLMEELGDHAAAARYCREAEEYHATIMDAVSRIYRAEATPPVLPPHVYAKGAAGGEYYQLFAGLILDLLPFEFADPRANWLADFLEQDNRTLCLLPRFRGVSDSDTKIDFLPEGDVDIGPGGIDALYGLGYILSKLHSGRIREFLLGFYAFQAFDMEHTCFTSRESTPVYSSDLHLRRLYKSAAVTDPLPCSSAVALILLRHMLVTEETLGAGKHTGSLLVLWGAPRRWFRDGKSITVERMPTHFGPLSLRVESRVARGVIEAEVVAPGRDPCTSIKLRLRHPDGAKFRSVIVNGQPHADADSGAEIVEIRQPKGKYRVEVHY
jgi:hypothetical protein